MFYTLGDWDVKCTIFDSVWKLFVGHKNILISSSTFALRIEFSSN